MALRRQLKAYVKPAKISIDRDEWAQIRRNDSNMEYIYFGIHQNQEKNINFWDYDAQKVIDGCARSIVLEKTTAVETETVCCTFVCLFVILLLGRVQFCLPRWRIKYSKTLASYFCIKRKIKYMAEKGKDGMPEEGDVILSLYSALVKPHLMGWAQFWASQYETWTYWKGPIKWPLRLLRDQ